MKLSPEQKVLVEMGGENLLFIYGDPIIHNKPDPDTPGLTYFKNGQIYEVGQLILRDNESVYLEGSAVVRGTLFATSARNVSVRGNGVLDGGYFSAFGQHSHHMRLEDCENIYVEDIIMIKIPPAGCWFCIIVKISVSPTSSSWVLAAVLTALTLLHHEKSELKTAC